MDADIEQNARYRMTQHYTSGDGTTQYTTYRLEPENSFMCRIGWHRAKRVIRKGWVSYFTPVNNVTCPCMKYVWVEFDGSFVSREPLNRDWYYD